MIRVKILGACRLASFWREVQACEMARRPCASKNCNSPSSVVEVVITDARSWVTFESFLISDLNERILGHSLHNQRQIPQPLE